MDDRKRVTERGREKEGGSLAHLSGGHRQIGQGLPASSRGFTSAVPVPAMRRSGIWDRRAMPLDSVKLELCQLHARSLFLASGSREESGIREPSSLSSVHFVIIRPSSCGARPRPSMFAPRLTLNGPSFPPYSFHAGVDSGDGASAACSSLLSQIYQWQRRWRRTGWSPVRPSVVRPPVRRSQSH